ncbi:MAG: DEAD/DEAH box helicase, partial [Candidatus Heimdallarchaeota archaeon]|nr:DEAD/DEAH box helicase [Candidatus Heimdallarchaeota archaeon]
TEYEVMVFHARKKKKVAGLVGDHLRFLIVGIESMSQGTSHLVIEEFASNNKCMIVIDESNMIKNFKSNRTKKIQNIGFIGLFRRILSGTPISKGIEDLYAQFFFLDPSILNHQTFYTFRNTFCLMGGYKNKNIVGHQNEDIFYERVRGFTFNAKKKDWLDLPDKLYEKRVVELTDVQKKYYDQMKDELIVITDGGQVEATTVLTKVLRMQQIIGGFIPLERTIDGIPTGKWDTTRIPGTIPKLEELKNVADQIDGKMIVWCKYVAEVDLVRETLAEIGRNPVVAHGGLSDDERTNNRRLFQDEKSIITDDPSQYELLDNFKRKRELIDNKGVYEVVMIEPSGVTDFVAQIDSMGIGITLTAASYVIYYSNPYSYIVRIQSEDRAHRAGQKNNVTYIELVAKGTLDESILEILKRKGDMSEEILKNIKGVVDGRI